MTLVATWAESGKVHLWDVTKHVVMLDSPAAGMGGASSASLKGHVETPLHTFSGHKVRVDVEDEYCYCTIIITAIIMYNEVHVYCCGYQTMATYTTSEQMKLWDQCK